MHFLMTKWAWARDRVYDMPKHWSLFSLSDLWQGWLLNQENDMQKKKQHIDITMLMKSTAAAANLGGRQGGERTEGPPENSDAY
jgi:hypothetical protein